MLRCWSWLLFIGFFQIVKSFWSLLFKEKSENHYSEQELLDIVDKAQSEGSLQEAEGDLIRRSIEFNDLDVYSILTPRVDVVAINFDWDPEKIKEVIEGERVLPTPCLQKHDWYLSLVSFTWRTISRCYRRTKALSPLSNRWCLLRLIMKFRNC